MDCETKYLSFQKLSKQSPLKSLEKPIKYRQAWAMKHILTNLKE